MDSNKSSWFDKFEIGVLLLMLVLVMSVASSGCKVSAYDSSNGDSDESTRADDGSVVNDNDVSVGGDLSVDDGSGIAEGGGVVVSDSDELLEGETDLQLCASEFLWKPESESGGLAILFPEECPEFIEACVFDADDGEEECQGVFSTDDLTGRIKFQFSGVGGEYTGDIRATDEEGVVYSFSVVDPAVRNDL